MYSLTRYDVKKIAELVRDKLEEKGRKSGGLEYNKAAEAAYQMIRYYIPKMAKVSEE